MNYTNSAAGLALNISTYRGNKIMGNEIQKPKLINFRISEVRIAGLTSLIQSEEYHIKKSDHFALLVCYFFTSTDEQA